MDNLSMLMARGHVAVTITAHTTARSLRRDRAVR
jgi:hypothetical protein